MRCRCRNRLRSSLRCQSRRSQNPRGWRDRSSVPVSIEAHATMTHKTPKIDAMLAGMEEIPGFDRHYVGFFRCFNAQLYYEAHDVLEEVWLPIRGQPQARFYQGLIQTAG